MLKIDQITSYHLKNTSHTKLSMIGFELEIFALDQYSNRIFYLSKRRDLSFEKVFKHLITKKGFTQLDMSKTYGIKGSNGTITLEPGSQFEFSSFPCGSISSLVKNYIDYLKLLSYLSVRYKIKWIDSSYFPVGKADDYPLLPKDRYRLMDRYFRSTGKLGAEMMRNTASLQVAIDYNSKEDLEKKVNKLLLLKPILLILTANSSMRGEKNSGFRSYREHIWNNTDSDRCMDPGINIWKDGKWSLESYVNKVLNAPIIFDVNNKAYVAVNHDPFRMLLKNSDIDSYVFHNNTIFTDIRVKQYIEVRYLDNPGIKYVLGTLILIYYLVYDEALWKKVKRLIPYSFVNVPILVKELNQIGTDKNRQQSKEIKAALIDLIECISAKVGSEERKWIELLLEKVENSDKNSNAFKQKSLLKSYEIQFKKNIEDLIDLN